MHMCAYDWVSVWLQYSYAIILYTYMNQPISRVNSE